LSVAIGFLRGFASLLEAFIAMGICIISYAREHITTVNAAQTAEPVSWR
jgi:hypothetical protein